MYKVVVAEKQSTATGTAKGEGSKYRMKKAYTMTAVADEQWSVVDAAS